MNKNKIFKIKKLIFILSLLGTFKILSFNFKQQFNFKKATAFSNLGDLKEEGLNKLKNQLLFMNNSTTVATLKTFNISVSEVQIDFETQGDQTKFFIRNVARGEQVVLVPIHGKQAQSPIVAQENAAGVYEAVHSYGAVAEKGVHVLHMVNGEYQFLAATKVNSLKEIPQSAIVPENSFSLKFYDANHKEKEFYMNGLLLDTPNAYYLHIIDSKGKDLTKFIAVAVEQGGTAEQDNRLPFIKYQNGTFGLMIDKRIFKNSLYEFFTINLYKGSVQNNANFDCYIRVNLNEPVVFETGEENKKNAKTQEKTKNKDDVKPQENEDVEKNEEEIEEKIKDDDNEKIKNKKKKIKKTEVEEKNFDELDENLTDEDEFLENFLF